MTPEYLLVTDLDGTLLGDDAALREFRVRRAQLPVRMRLVYASGRLVEDVQALIADQGLCTPDAVIGGVGTQISITDGAVANWCRPSARAWNKTRICALLSDIPLQPERFQTDYKVSFVLRDASPRALDEVARRLRRAEIDADLIYSSHRDLDVVPHGINKGSAANYLAKHWRIAPQNVIVCGDSGNDLALFQCQFRGVVVANHLPELGGLESRNVFYATAAYAAGVLQGIEHWLARETVLR